MHRHGDGLLILACLVVGLVALSIHSHTGYIPAGWGGTCARSVSMTYAAHMAELEFRRIAAAAGRIVSIR
jgi:hypothetical protein